jgi:hypothetical protein
MSIHVASRVAADGVRLEWVPPDDTPLPVPPTELPPEGQPEEPPSPGEVPPVPEEVPPPRPSEG